VECSHKFRGGSSGWDSSTLNRNDKINPKIKLGGIALQEKKLNNLPKFTTTTTTTTTTIIIIIITYNIKLKMKYAG
jgi:hypothetical protein